ncbi:MAG TPA: tetratricopeptide repeat protein, partial [Planctomycetota bacterium]|nr:tetratricopeptide repeat protein [Planctomycetota bacterium]
DVPLTQSNTGRGAAVGAATGAVLGGVIGAATGSWAWGALIGAGAGALTGYVIAEETDPAKDRARYEPVPANSTSYDADRQRRDDADREYRVAMAAKDSATAEYHLKRSLDFYPTPAAHNNLGLIYMQSGDRDRAREQFRAAVRLDPNYDPALQNLERLGGS